MKKLFYLVLTALLTLCCYLESQAATIDEEPDMATKFNNAIFQALEDLKNYGSESKTSVPESETSVSQIETSVPIKGNADLVLMKEEPVVVSTNESTVLPFYGQVLLFLSILVVFTFIAKHTFLLLQLTNYNRFLEERDELEASTWIKPKNYPKVFAREYLFNMKKWTLKAILDPFTETDYTNWCKTESRHIHYGAKSIML